MTFSVALCTYNGESFLREQLNSIQAQTRLPDELVVCDDGSDDNTVAIIQEFAARAPFPVHLHRNERNLGSTKNFERAIRLCQGDLIALCDQDDVWLPHKLERLEAAFAAPDVGLAFSNCELIDAEGHLVRHTLWNPDKLPSEMRTLQQGHDFAMLFRFNIVTGATMSFRAGFKDLVLPIPADIALIHDGWIALMIASVAKVAFIPEPLLQYRQHPAQQIGASGRPAKMVLPHSHYQAHLRQLDAFRTRWLEKGRPLASPAKVREVTQQLNHIPRQRRHIQARMNLPTTRPQRVLPVLRELLRLRYHRYSNGFPSAARDLWF